MWKWERTGRMEGVSNPSAWLGYSYRDYERDVRVFYLIPFNWIFRFFRTIINFIRYYWQGRDSGHTPENKAYQAGLYKGMEIERNAHNRQAELMYDRGWNDAINEMIKNVDKTIINIPYDETKTP